MKRSFILFVFFAAVSLSAQTKLTGTIVLQPDSARSVISRHLFGQFAEHLGNCVYGGLWVGEKSPIPNTRGIRNDVVAALRKVKVPSIRWPGGCFADTYHWKDGIGPRENRPKMVNSTWGGVVENNEFGTHEFMDLCEQLGAEPVISGNVGSGTVQEMSDWVDYLTADDGTPMALLRKANGREKPWKVTYWCVGNENWGCGGVMDAQHYSNVFAQYAYFLKDRGDNKLFRISSGGLDNGYDWTETAMKKWTGADGWLKGYLNGISLHSYTICNSWEKKGSATDFTEQEWFNSVSKTLRMDELVTKHTAVMDRYDPEKKIGLIVDEWGNWFDVEPGTNPGFLRQQNTMRDAVVAALNLDIFCRHTDRIRMTNISQMVNVLQTLIFTDGPSMVLTPTYHVYDLYTVHHDARFIPAVVTSDRYGSGESAIPALSSTASRDSGGVVHISMTNVHPSTPMTVRCRNVPRSKSVTARILTSRSMQEHNTAAAPNTVSIVPFTALSRNGADLVIELPARSVVTIELKP